jgi:hypothetical protein
MPFYNKKPVAIGELIKTYVDKYPRKRELKRGMVLALVPKITGERINNEISNAWFRDDVLCFKVKNQAWRQEIHFQRFKLIQKFNQEVKDEIVKDIMIY